MRIKSTLRIIIVVVGLGGGLVFGLIEAKEPVNLLKNPGLSNRVKVAILDTGSNSAYKEGISLIDGTVRDYNGHGTLMAGIIKEIYSEVEFYIVKVIGRDGAAVNEETVILGLEWAISRGVDIINMSLRLKGSDRLYRTIRKAYNKGIVIVAAAGNKDSAIGYPAIGGDTEHRTPDIEVAYPAKYDEVIAVGALDRFGNVHHGSVQGEYVDIFCKGYKGRYAGTSIACAYAAGLAAEIISKNPNSGIKEVKKIMNNKIGNYKIGDGVNLLTY